MDYTAGVHTLNSRVQGLHISHGHIGQAGPQEALGFSRLRAELVVKRKGR